MNCEIAMLRKFHDEIEKIEAEIRRLAYKEENVRLLMTLPGIDDNTATAVLAAFGDISRFKDADHAASYFGNTSHARTWESVSTKRQRIATPIPSCRMGSVVTRSETKFRGAVCGNVCKHGSVGVLGEQSPKTTR